ncbi:PREDICTED: protein DJ-1 homolog C-like [Diuraphis noxia]|uniref:protein DJ-1 homolog C-like n=1 Tax=Diuraphis noxia TaxID=143948 RepID=UPI000763A472|nr:PREDICTED: protein DJ-1 homolog C-like [Diuraphis noxia]
MLHKLLIFAKPYCSGYSSIKALKPLFALDVQRNYFFNSKYSSKTCTEMATKTALFIVAEGSEELELVAPVDILRRANVTVTIADLNDCVYVKTKSNLLIKTDAKLGDVKNHKFDAVVIPGGPSYKVLASVRNLVTSRGPATAIEFGLSLVEVLLGNEEKIKVAKGILYPL